MMWISLTDYIEFDVINSRFFFLNPYGKKQIDEVFSNL